MTVQITTRIMCIDAGESGQSLSTVSRILIIIVMIIMYIATDGVMVL